jgi:hypothetical protein
MGAGSVDRTGLGIAHVIIFISRCSERKKKLSVVSVSCQWGRSWQWSVSVVSGGRAWMEGIGESIREFNLELVWDVLLPEGRCYEIGSALAGAIANICN